MSKKNILSKETVNGRLRVTFDSHDGERTYAYSPQATLQINKGKDPSNYTGNLIRHVKKEK